MVRTLESTAGGMNVMVKTIVRHVRSVPSTTPALGQHRPPIGPTANPANGNPTAMSATTPAMHSNLATIVRKGTSVRATVPTVDERGRVRPD
jgi:hypothetical protein